MILHRVYCARTISYDCALKSKTIYGFGWVFYLLLMACIFSVMKCGKIQSNSNYLLMQLALSALVQFSATPGAMANDCLIG